ncbi:MAG: PDGLE domain-containing protein [Candidatus Omnitrophica bacterium]|nr:PDGLE domain-containing protein [Candidatus Omnitrophota bacterium]
MKKSWIIIGLFISLLLVLFISPFASSSPDGLERIAEDKGFLEKGEGHIITSPIPDYVWPGIEDEGVATSMAGVFGTLITFGLGLGIGSILKRR